MQNLSEKRTQWCGNGSKVAHLGPKSPFFGHKRPQTPQMAGKSGSNGGSQWNTCGRTNLGEKLVRKNAPSSVEMAPKWPIWGQNRHFLAIRGSRRPRWPTKVDQMVDHSWTHVGGLA